MRIRCLLFAFGFILVGSSFHAQAADGDWTFRLYGALVDSSAGISAGVEDGTFTGAEIGGSGGMGLGFEYRFSRWVGVDFSTMLAFFDIGVAVTPTAVSVDQNLQMLPLTLGVPVHFLPRSKVVDLYLEPNISYVNYFDIDLDVGQSGASVGLNIGSDTAPGVTLGLDLPANKKWAFSTSYRYMKTRAENLDIDPTIFTVGFAIHF